MTELEQDIIRVQAWAYLNRAPYNSMLLSVDKLDSVKASCRVKEDGGVDEQEFLSKTLELAESLDDFRDLSES